MLRILCMGDAVGDAGVRTLAGGRLLSRLRKELRADLVIVNAENSAPANGMTAESARALFDAGADVLTGGNHTWRVRGIGDFLEETDNVLRPANFPSAAAGHGAVLADCIGGRVLVMNLIGCAFMDPVDSPFTAADRLLAEYAGRFDYSVIDFHAEATSEKLALARYLDGRVSAIFGTHTHVPTADAQILPGGTGYVTDVGMCGSHAGVLGVSTDAVLHKYLVKTPAVFTHAEGNNQAHGVLFTLENGICTAVEAVTKYL